MNWPFELPPMPPPAIHGETYESAAFNYWQATDVRAYADACIAAALRWAADEARREVLIGLHIRCIPRSVEIADTVRDFILAALPKENADGRP